MEVLLAALFLYGCAYAARQGGRTAWRSYRASPPGAHHRAGYVASQVARGFPEFRHGVARGWDAHRTAALGHQAAREDARTRNQAEQQRLRGQIEDYRRRREAAAARPPVPGDPPAAPGTGVPPGHDPGPDVTDIPVRVNSPAAPPGLGEKIRRELRRIERERGGQPPAPAAPATWTLDELLRLLALARQISPQQPANGKDKESTMPAGTANGSGGGDASLETTKQILAALVTAAEATISSREADDGIRLADQLPGVIPDDAETLGLATDLAGYLQQAGRLSAQIQETATSMRDRVSKTYDATQDAVDASGTAAPQPEFLQH